jgi:phage repressor protein C with HTH and peptisase S24 domain
MLRVLKVSGHSLEPRYRDGDFVLISKIPILFGWLHQGDEIVFHQRGYGTLIKIVERLEGEAIYVMGLHSMSVDSRNFGPINRQAVIGKVIWRFKRQ